MPTRPELTLFDLDHTLLDSDSNQLWLAWLVEQGVAAPGRLAQQADFYARYQAGTLDIDAYLAFHLSLLVERSVEAWRPLRDAFVAARIVPRVTDAARAAVAAHRARGDTIAVVTATHDFLAAGILSLFGNPPLVATRCAATDTGMPSIAITRIAEPSIAKPIGTPMTSSSTNTHSRIVSIAPPQASAESITDSVALRKTASGPSSTRIIAAWKRVSAKPTGIATKIQPTE
jgi:phosphoserine phosphatase